MVPELLRCEPLPVRFPTPVVSAVLGGSMHLLGATDAGVVAHLAVGPDGRAALLDAPRLSWVTGAAAAEGGLVVAGGRAGDAAPVVCGVAAGGRPTWEAPLRPDGPLTGGPVLVTVGDGSWRAVWSTGGGVPAVSVGGLAGGQVRGRALVTGPIASWRAGAVGGVLHLLCHHAPRTLRLHRVDGEEAGAARDLPLPRPAAAVLAEDLVLVPSHDATLLAWTVREGLTRELVLPLPRGRERALAQVAEPRLVPGSRPGRGALLWSTARPPELGERARGWVAELDLERWSVGAPLELPAPGRVRAAGRVGDTLLVVHGLDATFVSTLAWGAPGEG